MRNSSYLMGIWDALRWLSSEYPTILTNIKGMLLKTSFKRCKSVGIPTSIVTSLCLCPSLVDSYLNCYSLFYLPNETAWQSLLLCGPFRDEILSRELDYLSQPLSQLLSWPLAYQVGCSSMALPRLSYRCPSLTSWPCMQSAQKTPHLMTWNGCTLVMESRTVISGAPHSVTHLFLRDQHSGHNSNRTTPDVLQSKGSPCLS